MRIAIAGATGAVGRHVVDIVRERGHVPVPLSRSAGVDLLNPAAVAGALIGADSVIDVASISTTSGTASKRFYRDTTTNLLAAGAAAGVGHHVALSIVNVDRAPSGYYAGKVVQERLVASGPLPWSILRATQFHEFAAQILERAKLGPVHAIPMMRTQPVAAREVAARLVELAETDARGRAADLAGPREERLVELARAYAAAKGLRGTIVSIPLPGGMGAAMRSGALLPGPEAQRGTLTFAEWLRAIASPTPNSVGTRGRTNHSPSSD
jgi:uncharacterized protein YbjT (DUF2867 family)